MRSFSLALILMVAGNAHALAPTPTEGDFGGIGLMQTPTARMADDGTLALHLSRAAPYGRLALVLQPFDWLEGTYRYTDITTRLYGPTIAGNQSYKDKSFDIKLRLSKESQLMPQIALGARDIGGTGIFSGEYIVATKRWYDLDFSLGLGWGYLGKRGDIENPLGLIYPGFKTRPDTSSSSQGGTVAFTSFFRGHAALFGGIQWQTPWDPLQLKIEYEGNNYQNEYGGPTVKQDSAINYGASYRLNDALSMHAAWERGNTLMLGLTLQGDLSPRRSPTPKISDPQPEKLPQDLARPKNDPNWAEVAERLEKNAGYKVQRIAKRNKEIVVHAEQERYFYPTAGIGRGARILDNASAEEIDWLTFSETKAGMPITETSIQRTAFRKAIQKETPLESARSTVEQVDPMPRQETTLYKAAPADPFSWGSDLSYSQNLGGPNGFILYQFNANLNAEYRLAPGTWIDGLLSYNFLNNYSGFTYTAPTGLPRVRTNLREYLVTSDLVMPRLQFTHAERLQPEWYGMVYGGFLESMYAGVGGEVLYRPLRSSLALGLNVNWVQQRDFAQDFGLRDYKVLTGHLSAYFRNPLPETLPGLLVTTSVGRYLAKDIGVTFDVAREFTNGVRMGAWATLTNVSAAQFGEGSFDKGFYVSLPFDLLTTASTQSKATMMIQPLTRDGGARLSRNKTLYDMTDGRNLDFFHQNFEMIRN